MMMIMIMMKANQKTMKPPTNTAQLKPISESKGGAESTDLDEESDFNEEDIDPNRKLNIGEVSSAKSASRTIRSKSGVLQKRKNKDFGIYEVISADYPISKDDLMLARTKTYLGDVHGRGNRGSQLGDVNYALELDITNSTKYQMKPLRKFKAEDAEIIIKTILEEALDDKEYEPEFCRYKARVLSDTIKDKVKKLFLPRYKVISKVFMGQVGQHSIRVASRCAWDGSVDNYAEYTYRNSTLWAVGLVFGVYCE